MSEQIPDPGLTRFEAQALVRRGDADGFTFTAAERKLRAALSGSAKALTQHQLSDEDRERVRRIAAKLRLRANVLDGEDRPEGATSLRKDAAFLRKLASQPVRDDAVPVVRAELGDDRIDFELECGHTVGLAFADVAETNDRDEIELPTSLVCPVCVASNQQHGEVEEDAKPIGWSLIHQAHGSRAEVVISARRTWIAEGHYNEEGGEYRGHVVVIDDGYVELDKEGNTRIRIEWPDVLDASLWSDLQHHVPTKGEEGR